MLGGLGGSEIIIIAILFLVIFGPGKVPEMARDLGRFINEARSAVDEFKEELTTDPEDEPKKSDRDRNGGRGNTPEQQAHKRNGKRESSEEHTEEDGEERTDEKGEGVYDL